MRLAGFLVSLRRISIGNRNPSSTHSPRGSGVFVTGAFLTLFILGKMVGFEGLKLGVQPFELNFTAVLLPLAMVLGRFAVAGISIGCPLAHLFDSRNFLDVGSAGAAAFVGSALAYMLVKRYSGYKSIFAGSVVITASWTLIFGAYFAFASNLPMLTGFAETASSLWIGVNVAGVALAIGLSKLRSRGAQI